MSVRLRVCVVTGSRAEFGLLDPVMSAIGALDSAELLVVVAGSHMLPPAFTHREVERRFPTRAKVFMQTPDELGRLADARALGRGVTGFADAFTRLDPDWVVVLGDRVEALAAAAAASVGGVPVAQVHAGDRAEGVADEAMRHAITKLAHLHLCATEQSGQRVLRMGERDETVRVVGSPALDGLDDIPAMTDAETEALGNPTAVLLLHPIGRDNASERRACEQALRALEGERVLALHPNHDAGRAGIMDAILAGGADGRVVAVPHLPRAQFVGLVKRLAQRGGAVVGNSSGALIECAYLCCPAVDIGARQSGRERPPSVVHTDDEQAPAIAAALAAARAIDRAALSHPYGPPGAGARIAEAIVRAGKVRDNPSLLRKRCTY